MTNHVLKLVFFRFINSVIVVKESGEKVEIKSGNSSQTNLEIERKKAVPLTSG